MLSVFIPSWDKYIDFSPYPFIGSTANFLKLDLIELTAGSSARGPFASPSRSIKVRRAISALNSFKELMTLSTVERIFVSERLIPMLAEVVKSDLSSISAPSNKSVIELLSRVTCTPSKVNVASEASWLNLFIVARYGRCGSLKLFEGIFGRNYVTDSY